MVNKHPLYAKCKPKAQCSVASDCMYFSDKPDLEMQSIFDGTVTGKYHGCSFYRDKDEDYEKLLDVRKGNREGKILYEPKGGRNKAKTNRLPIESTLPTADAEI